MRSIPLTIITVIALSLAACGKETVITPDKSATEKIQEYNKVTGNDLENSPTHGAMTQLWYGALTGTESTPANGVGFLRQFEDDVFTGSLNLNIVPRTDGKLLIAWMAQSDGGNPIRVGELTSIVGDARHSLSFESTEDLSDKTVVVITLEADAESAAPGTRVAEGTLKEVVQ